MLVSCVVVDQETAWDVWGLFSLYYIYEIFEKKEKYAPFMEMD